MAFRRLVLNGSRNSRLTMKDMKLMKEFGTDSCSRVFLGEQVTRRAGGASVACQEPVQPLLHARISMAARTADWSGRKPRS
jgi:hypothetical protein